MSVRYAMVLSEEQLIPDLRAVVLPSEHRTLWSGQCYGVRWLMNCSVRQLYWVFSVKTMTSVSLVGLLECNVVCFSLHLLLFCVFLFLIQSWQRWPLLRWVHVFVGMKCLYSCVCMNTEYTFIHMSYFQLNSFVHSVLNKCTSIDAVFVLCEGVSAPSN